MRRFETLDFLRGIAAFGVLLYHVGMRPGMPQSLPHGYLAVDFFFVLSGFVIAHAYAGKLAAGMPWRAFLRRRAVRMYPLAAIGVLLGLVVLVARWRLLPGKSDGPAAIGASALLNLFLLPSPFSGPGSEYNLFPGDGPLWSLFLELAVNLIWAAVAVRASTASLVAVTCLSAVALAVLAARSGTASMGFDPETLAGGVARIGFGFTAGVLIQRLRPPPTRARRWRPVILAFLLLAIFAMPESWAPPASAPWLIWDLAAILLAMPAIVAMGMGEEDTGLAGRLSGRLSYALYAIHYPLLAMASGAYQTGRIPFGPGLLYCLAVIGILAASYVATAVYDEPLRAWLSRQGRVRHGV